MGVQDASSKDGARGRGRLNAVMGFSSKKKGTLLEQRSNY
jgi:hypothetical protein